VSRRPAPVAVLTALIALALAGGARADVFGPIALASESPAQQAEYAHDAVISSNGRYVAFDGSFAGRPGVWRRNLLSGAVEQVAGGDAERPSISADGRYISFTTTAALTRGDSNESPDVYVRDMEVQSAQACVGAEPEGEVPPCPFTLVSAADGSEEGLSYEAGSGSAYGSLAAGRTAISADGRQVAFITTAVSDLVGPRPPLVPTTPAMQVAVRDLDTRTTQLVSVVAPAGGAPQPVSATEGAQTLGAAYAPGGQQRFTPVDIYGSDDAWGASISADGSTVAWLGVNVGQQAAFLPGETVRANYTEPLWRRISEGPSAPTLRVTGGSDPLNPACVASGESALPIKPSLSDPCQGPFDTRTLFEASPQGTWKNGTVEDFVPQLSADGYTVAFLADAPLVLLGSNFERTTFASDAYVADMHPGLTRGEALRPLSRLASGVTQDIATNGPILDLAISADGTQVAFTSKRTVFALGVPAFVSTPAAVPGMSELFEADLDDQTLTRVTQGFEGGAGEHPHATVPSGEDPYRNIGDGALSPSFTGDGHTLAFSSTADNLVFGDGNTPPLGSEAFDGSDAFVVSRVVFSSSTPRQYISPPPPAPALSPTWALFVTALSRRDGTVVLRVLVPGAGVLSVSARASLLVRARSGRAGGHSRLAPATVATRRAAPAAAGQATLVLKLAPRYSPLAARRGGFAATAKLVFAAAGRRTIRQQIEVSFRRVGSAASRNRLRHAGRGTAQR